MESVMNIEEILHEVVKVQQYLRLRERKHRDSMNLSVTMEIDRE